MSPCAQRGGDTGTKPHLLPDRERESGLGRRRGVVPGSVLCCHPTAAEASWFLCCCVNLLQVFPTEKLAVSRDEPLDPVAHSEELGISWG